MSAACLCLTVRLDDTCMVGPLTYTIWGASQSDDDRGPHAYDEVLNSPPIGDGGRGNHPVTKQTRPRQRIASTNAQVQREYPMPQDMKQAGVPSKHARTHTHTHTHGQAVRTEATACKGRIPSNYCCSPVYYVCMLAAHSLVAALSSEATQLLVAMTSLRAGGRRTHDNPQGRHSRRRKFRSATGLRRQPQRIIHRARVR